jgi:hypothetical protein
MIEVRGWDRINVTLNGGWEIGYTGQGTVE